MRIFQPGKKPDSSYLEQISFVTLSVHRRGMNQESKVQWYQIPVVWVVIGIPVLSIVVTLSIVWISIISFDGLVVDDYYSRGLEINRDLARDRYANSIGLSGNLQIKDQTVTLLLHTDIEVMHSPRLELGFYHPTVANRDTLVNLQHQGAGSYSGSLPVLASGRWNVVVGTDKWRLEGVFHYPRSSELRLLPVRLGRDG